MKQGWIFLDRKLMDNPIWLKKPFSYGQAWVDLILMANHKDEKIAYDGFFLEVKRGSMVTSILKLSERWGWSRKKVVNFLEMLKSGSMADRKSDNRRTVITIANYSTYQDKGTTKGTAKEQQKNIRGTSEEHQKSTNNKYIINDKECKEKKNAFFSSPAGDMTPDELEALKAKLRK